MAEFKKLLFGKVVKDVTRNYSKIPKTDYLAEGLYPIIDQGKDFICGYTNDPQKVTTKDKPVIIFGDHTRIFKLIDFPIAIGADGVKVLEVDSSLADEEFVYEYLRTINLHNAGYSRHFKYLKEVKIPVPDSKDNQKRIASVLQKIKALISQREESIQLTDEFLKHSFLTMFGDPVNNTNKWSLIKLSELGKLDRGVSKHRPRNAPELLGGKHPLIQTGDVSNAGLYIKEHNSTYSDIGLAQSKLWPKGTLCITIAANIAKTGILTFDACFPDSVVGFTPKKTAISLYVHYLMGFLQNILEKNAPQAGQKNINLGILRSLLVPNPDKDLLVNFEKIVNQTESIKNQYTESLNELNELYHSLSHKAFNGDLTIIEKIEIEGSIKIRPKITATVEVIEQKTPITTIPEPAKKKEEVAASITHIPFLKTEEDLLSHISRNCSGSHFTFEDIKKAVKGLDWTYDFEELKNLVFSLVRKKQLKQVFADASYKSGFKKTDAAFKEITDLSEQIYFKRML